MVDRFEDKAEGWDAQPVPVQISRGVGAAMLRAVALSSTDVVMDFGAGTGLICGQLAGHVAKVLAVDVSPAMLAQLRAKPELAGKVETRCQDILEAPLGETVDLVVSAMAMHHVADTAALLRALHDHLAPGGRLALADLDTEDGDFHPANAEGVFHLGFDRDALRGLLEAAGFVGVTFETACTVQREGKDYPIFLVTAARAAAAVAA
jgi:SAM-dependent methyltransferase